MDLTDTGFGRSIQSCCFYFGTALCSGLGRLYLVFPCRGSCCRDKTSCCTDCRQDCCGNVLEPAYRLCGCMGQPRPEPARRKANRGLVLQQVTEFFSYLAS